MKKVLLGIGLSMATLVAQAAQWQTFSLFGGGITAVTVTNAAMTGQGGAITNLLSRGLQTTNVNGIVITNMGSRVVTTNDVATDVNLLSDYWPIPTRADGSPPYTAVSNFVTGVYYPSDYSFNCKLQGTHANLSIAQTFTFVPVTGKGADAEMEEGEAWNVSFVPSGATLIQCNTNIPLHRWPGAAGLRLKRIVNTDQDGSASCVITDLSINGPRP